MRGAAAPTSASATINANHCCGSLIGFSAELTTSLPSAVVFASDGIRLRPEVGASAADVIGSLVRPIARQLKAISFWECVIAFGEEVTVLGLRSIGFAAKAVAFGARAAGAASFPIAGEADSAACLSGSWARSKRWAEGRFY